MVEKLGKLKDAQTTLKRSIKIDIYRDRAAFLRLGGLNKMPKAFLARAVGASVLGGSGGMLPRKKF